MGGTSNFNPFTKSIKQQLSIKIAELHKIFDMVAQPDQVPLLVKQAELKSIVRRVENIVLKAQTDLIFLQTRYQKV